MLLASKWREGFSSLEWENGKRVIGVIQKRKSLQSYPVEATVWGCPWAPFGLEKLEDTVVSAVAEGTQSFHHIFWDSKGKNEAEGDEERRKWGRRNKQGRKKGRRKQKKKNPRNTGSVTCNQDIIEGREKGNSNVKLSWGPENNQQWSDISRIPSLGFNI